MVLLLGSSLAATRPLAGQSVQRVTGDSDGDRAVTTADIFHSINQIYAAGPAAVGYADVNGDALHNRADVDYLVRHLLAVGPKPMEPWRLLEQTTWGPTDALVDHVRAVGFNAFLEEQFAAPMSSYPVYPPQLSIPPPECDAVCLRDFYTTYPLQRRFFVNALYGEDQLRQRVAWALHKIVAMSGAIINEPKAVSPYLRIFDRNAFGSFRQVLYEQSKNAAMAAWLSSLGNNRLMPNENYARELLQLFSIGTVLLNADGTPKLDAAGNQRPAYEQPEVNGFTRVFTGWFLAPTRPGEQRNDEDPLIPWNNGTHETGTKLLLGGVELPAGQTEEKDLSDAIDNIFNHPNTGPFIAKQLIQNLVTGHPSPAYVARVSAVFDDNGAGVRGDLKEVVRAIILDPEARNDAPAAREFGHLKEPVLFITGVLRAFNPRSADGSTQSDGYLNQFSAAMGQDVLRPPTVFSYYLPDYVAPGTTVVAPEFGIISDTTAFARTNLVQRVVFHGVPVSADAPAGTSIDLSGLQALASNPSHLVDEANRLLMHGSMSAAMHASIVQAVSAVPATNTLKRAQYAVYLTCSSHQYQVQR